MLLVNRRFEQLFKKSRVRMSSAKPTRSYFPAAMPPPTRKTIARRFDSGKPMEVEEPVLHARLASTRTSPINSRLIDPVGRPYAVGGISTDIYRP